jgi:hypothetical protein
MGEVSCAFLTTVSMLATPGPDVTAATPGQPVTRAVTVLKLAPEAFGAGFHGFLKWLDGSRGRSYTGLQDS